MSLLNMYSRLKFLTGTLARLLLVVNVEADLFRFDVQLRSGRSDTPFHTFEVILQDGKEIYCFRKSLHSVTKRRNDKSVFFQTIKLG